MTENGVWRCSRRSWSTSRRNAATSRRLRGLRVPWCAQPGTACGRPQMKIAVALLHLIFATTWFGTDFYFNFVVTPKLRTLEPSILGDVTTSLRRVTTPLLTVSAILTIVTGVVMMVQLHAKHPGTFSSTRWGTALLIGAVFSLLVLALAVVDRPTSKKLGRLVESFKGRAATAEETVEMSRLSERSILAGRVATILLLVALATMAVARYS